MDILMILLVILIFGLLFAFTKWCSYIEQGEETR
jgi:hypothetical protein